MIANLELFNRVFEFSQSVIGYDTYDMLPEKNVDYPFIVLDDMQDIPSNLKTDVIGRTTITVHIWGNNEMRLEVSEAIGKFIKLKEIESEHFKFKARLNEENSQLLNDTSVENTNLIHGVVTLVFDWFRKEQ